MLLTVVIIWWTEVICRSRRQIPSAADWMDCRGVWQSSGFYPNHRYQMICQRRECHTSDYLGRSGAINRSIMKWSSSWNVMTMGSSTHVARRRRQVPVTFTNLAHNSVTETVKVDTITDCLPLMPCLPSPGVLLQFVTAGYEAARRKMIHVRKSKAMTTDRWSFNFPTVI